MSDTVESGLVLKLEGDKALVSLLENEACDECNARILCRPGSGNVREMFVHNRLNAVIGNKVEISEMGNLLLKLSLMQFGVPLLGLTSGILLVYFFKLSLFAFPDEVTMSISGLIGMLLGGMLTWIWSKHIADKTSCVFEITAIQSSSL